MDPYIWIFARECMDCHKRDAYKMIYSPNSWRPKYISNTHTLSIPVFPKLWDTDLLYTEYAQNYWLTRIPGKSSQLTRVPVNSSPRRLSVDQRQNYLAQVLFDSSTRRSKDTRVPKDATHDLMIVLRVDQINQSIWQLHYDPTLWPRKSETDVKKCQDCCHV